MMTVGWRVRTNQGVEEFELVGGSKGVGRHSGQATEHYQRRDLLSEGV